MHVQCPQGVFIFCVNTNIIPFFLFLFVWILKLFVFGLGFIYLDSPFCLCVSLHPTTCFELNKTCLSLYSLVGLKTKYHVIVSCGLQIMYMRIFCAGNYQQFFYFLFYVNVFGLGPAKFNF